MGKQMDWLEEFLQNYANDARNNEGDGAASAAEHIRKYIREEIDPKVIEILEVWFENRDELTAINSKDDPSEAEVDCADSLRRNLIGVGDELVARLRPAAGDRPQPAGELEVAEPPAKQLHGERVATDCDHTWRLTETGYIRTWQIDFVEKTKTIRAYSAGLEEFGSEGAGDDHLECSTCLTTKPIPEGWSVAFL